MWNNESNSYENITIRDENSLEDINIDLYKNVDRLYFKVDSVYYRIKILDETENQYTYEIIDSETFPSKPTDTIQNKIVIVSSKFFSKENLKSTLQDLQVWIVSIAIAITMVIVQLIQYNLKRSENIDSDEAQDAISEYNKKVKIKPVNFPEYIAENNRNEKIKVFRAHIQSQLYKVRKKILTSNKPKEAEYLKLKKEQLETYLTPEYVENNIDSISVRYDKLHAENYVYNSYEKNTNFRKDYSSENIKVSSMATKKVLTSLVMATLISAISLQLYMNFSFNGGFWVIMISTLLSMAMTSFNARKSADSIYKTDILGVINNKSLILEDSIKWALTHPTNEKSYEMLLDDYFKEKLHEESDKIKQSYQDKFNSLSEEIKKIRNS